MQCINKGCGNSKMSFSDPSFSVFEITTECINEFSLPRKDLSAQRQQQKH